MTTLTHIIFLTALICGIVAPPVTKNHEEKKEDHGQEQGTGQDGLEEYMEYHRYLREVVNALESDGDFKKKLEQANEDDIRSGKIAHELQFVSHHVRTQLDEIKRRELERLKELMEKKIELVDNNEIDDPLHHHVDHQNPHTFEIDDLKKLIKKTTEDLAEADRKRRDEFKEYELQKEYEKQQKLNHTTADERDKLEHEFKELEDKHKKHEKLHEPGHKQQLEEVWEEQDHMQQDFNPKTFFMLHDLDGNGLWDETEVKALFIKELDKMYAAGAPEDDMRERAEEMERMRESVFAEVDTNRDGFIDFDEFIAQTKRNDFQQDNGWQGLDEQRQFTDEEYEQYVRQHNVPPYQQVPPGYQQMPQGYHPQGGYPPQGDGYPPQGGYHPQGGNPPPQGGYHGNQHPNAPVPPQYHAGQQQQQQYQGNQQYHPKQENIQQHRQQQGLPELNMNEVYPNQPSYQGQGQQQNQGQYPNGQAQPTFQQQQQPNLQQQQPNTQQQQPNIHQQQLNSQQQQQPNTQQQQPNIHQQQLNTQQQQLNIQQQPNTQQQQPNIQQQQQPNIQQQKSNIQQQQQEVNQQH